LYRLDAKSLKQQELLYQQDFQIQQMERKVARASGERTNEEKKILNAKIAELQKELEEQVCNMIVGRILMIQTQLHVHLTSQLKRLLDELRYDVISRKDIEQYLIQYTGKSSESWSLSVKPKQQQGRRLMS